MISTDGECLGMPSIHRRKNPSAPGPTSLACLDGPQCRFSRQCWVRDPVIWSHENSESLDWFKGKSTGNHDFTIKYKTFL